MSRAIPGRDESERLLNGILPFAEKMLREYGEFHPYGGYLDLSGELVHVGAQDPTSDFPRAYDLIARLQSSFREMARARRCKAVAIVFDVRVKLPDSTDKSDAVQISLDHSDGYSAEVFFPYRIVNRKVIYGETFAQEGKHGIFGAV